RGCNNPLKLKEVLDFLARGSLDVLALLETRIRRDKVAKVIQNHLRKYSVICNYDWHRNGRIWVIWNPITVTVLPIEMAAQFVHSRDWLVLGDFNVVRSTEERVSSHLPLFSDIMDFNQCVLSCGLEDIQGTGCEFTWSNRQDGDRVWCKLDRAMVTPSLLQTFPSASVNFLPPGISDHSPVMVTLLGTQRFRKRFSFLNCWTKDPSYMDNLQRVWNSPTSGSTMFSFFSKLRRVRLMLMTLHRSNYTNIRRRVEQARDNLESCQLQLEKSPLNADLIDEERSYLANYLKLRRAELSILTQKAKFDTTLYNDSGTKFFHARINERLQAHLIGEIMDHHGQIRQGTEGVAAGFIEYYKHLLGTSLPVTELDVACVTGERVHQQQWETLLAPVLDTDIRKVVQSIDPLRSPGPDGFSAGFFTHSWSVIGDDLCKCVQEFFQTGCMLKQANTTLLSLIPKKKTVASVLDFRPISCCSVVYKVITKVLCSKLQELMPALVGP
ncbi:hypothetical protein RND81_07G057900, partial [Saponaria officinalis]